VLSLLLISGAAAASTPAAALRNSRRLVPNALALSVVLVELVAMGCLSSSSFYIAVMGGARSQVRHSIWSFGHEDGFKLNLEGEQLPIRRAWVESLIIANASSCCRRAKCPNQASGPFRGYSITPSAMERAASAARGGRGLFDPRVVREL
jgi:hypothetical protein